MNINLIIPILFGWFSGYLVNYLVDVLPATRRLSQAICGQCGASFTWRDYLLLHSCNNGHQRGARTWTAQFSMLILSIYIWSSPPLKIGYTFGLLLIIYLAVVFAIDLEHRLILHPTSIFGAILCLAIGSLKWGFFTSLLGGAAGLLIMLVFYYLGVLFTRIRLKRLLAKGHEIDDEEALGAGDVILAAVLGLLLGWPLIWFGLVVGILFGGFFSLILIVWLLITRKYDTNAFMLFIPYGPYFIASAFLIIYFPKFVQLLVPGN
ncbi:MAG: prepilin peptidase [Chloroflexi bacterium]|nr:prepilin peptidase [Chloroflexota bacterium]